LSLDSCGEHLTAPFPEDVGAPVQYGPNIQATALYLGGYQLIPYQRLAELFTDLFHCPLSQGTLASFVKRGSQKAILLGNCFHGPSFLPPPAGRGWRGLIGEE